MLWLWEKINFWRTFNYEINKIWNAIDDIHDVINSTSLKEIRKMVGELAALQAQVAETIRVEGEALAALQADVTKIADLAAQLAAALADNVPAQELAALTASLKTATDELVPVVEPAANTGV